jgi:hypothetical protein
VPVKIFRTEIGRKKEKDMLVLEDEINNFEQLLKDQGLQISNIALSAATEFEGALYCMVHFGSK